MTMKFPQTLAAVKQAEGDQWKIGDALVEEVGKPTAEGGKGDGSTAKFKACAAELQERGFDYAPDTLRKIRNVAAAFTGRRRPVSFAACQEAGSPEVLELAIEALGKPKPSKREIRAFVKARKAAAKKAAAEKRRRAEAKAQKAREKAEAAKRKAEEEETAAALAEADQAEAEAEEAEGEVEELPPPPTRQQEIEGSEFIGDLAVAFAAMTNAANRIVNGEPLTDVEDEYGVAVVGKIEFEAERIKDRLTSDTRPDIDDAFAELLAKMGGK